VARERLFFTGSTNIIRDPRPSGLDLRVYGCVSLHDGMSLLKGAGRGCYATFATLTAEIGCDAANLSRSLKRLVEWGYLTEERQDDRRRKTYRVVFETAETWRNRQQSPDEIVGNGESGNGSYLPQTEQHYSSLKELDAFEKEKLNSSEEARFARCSPEKIEFSDNAGGQMARLERALSVGQVVDRMAWYEWLENQVGADDNPSNNGRATRLSEKLVEQMDEAEYQQWGEQHGWVDDDGKWHAPHPRESEA
jgi:DNA-binding MarR family transcriptional regulator